MENRLQIQDFQNDELYMELTPEELEELKELKGGFWLDTFRLKGFVIGIPPYAIGVPVDTLLFKPPLATTPIRVDIDTPSIVTPSLKNLGTQLSI